MTAIDIGKAVAACCKQGKNQEAIDRFSSPAVEGVEPVAMPGMEQTQHGGVLLRHVNARGRAMLT